MARAGTGSTEAAGRLLRACLLAACVLAAAAALAPQQAHAGRMLASGHDYDAHCRANEGQCHFLKVALDWARAAAPDPTKPVLVLEMPGDQYLPATVSYALDNAYGPGVVPRESIDPASDAFKTLTISTTKYSAVFVGSFNDAINATGVANINARKADLHAFFNQGGGVIAGSGEDFGDAPGDPYYQFMPFPVGGQSVTPPFRLTPEGQAFGFHDSAAGIGTENDINCCYTHNSFAEPQAGGAIKVAERDASNAAETVFAEGIVENGQVVQAQCRDKQDNDGDGKTDHPADPGCSSPDDTDEYNATATTVCSNGADDDGDGKADYPNDPGCTDPSDGDESEPACANKQDDDGDGKADYPNDPGCASIADNDEQDLPQCGDSLDNDGDGKADWPADPGCNTPGDPTEQDTVVPRCSDTFDNDGDGKTDFPTDPGCESSSDDEEADPTVASECSDESDNDGDGVIDFGEDPGCSSADDDDETDPPECSDEFDNDLDDLIDYPADPSCATPADDDEQDYWACGDEEDNDGDGKTDHPADPGCAAPDDDDETDPPPASKCSNGIDDDGDGKTDFPADPGCVSAGDASEQDPPPPPACGDTKDNDGDGKVDYPNDPGCTTAGDNSEQDPPVNAMPACNDGKDNDADAKADYPADPGCTSAADTDEADPVTTVTECSDESDNDGDGKIDHPGDPGCSSASDSDETDPPVDPGTGPGDPGPGSGGPGPGPGGPGPLDPGPAIPFDTTPPDTLITAGPPPVVRGSVTEATFAFTSEPGARFECRIQRPGVDWEACSSPWERFNFMPGAHRVEVRAIDAAGNADPTPATHGWQVRSARLKLSGLPRRCAPRTFKVTVRVTDSLPVASVELLVDGRSIGKTKRRRFTTRVHTRRLKRGRHRLEVRVDDGSGNRAKRGYSFRVC